MRQAGPKPSDADLRKEQQTMYTVEFSDGSKSEQLGMWHTMSDARSHRTGLINAWRRMKRLGSLSSITGTGRCTVTTWDAPAEYGTEVRTLKDTRFGAVNVRGYIVIKKDGKAL